MNLHKSKIDWCTHTWNPVTGCLHGCDYCYAKRFIARFEPHACEMVLPEPLEFLPKGSGCFIIDEPSKLYDENVNYLRSTPYPKGFAPTFHGYAMDYPTKRRIPSRVFVSSMGDLFGAWVPAAWIYEVFSECLKAPQHTYLFLTKNPQRYQELAAAGKLPQEDNFWYGSTVTGPDEPFWWSKKHNTYVSIEPLLKPFEEVGADAVKKVGWVIIGAMTGPGSKFRQPRPEWVQAIVNDAQSAGVPVFMKDNLKKVYGDNLLREHPEGMVWPEEGHH